MTLSPDYYNEEEITKLLIIENHPIVLDTNILINAYSSQKREKEIIANFIGQNDVYISDTVFWEFLRNCNAEQFRDRRGKLLKILTDQKIIQEDKNVEKNFERLYFLYLYAFKNKPRKIPTRNIPDLWIAAACTYKRIDKILTCDHNNADFCPDFFDDEAFKISKQITLHIKTFNREKVRQCWIKMREAGVIDLKFEEYW